MFYLDGLLTTGSRYLLKSLRLVHSPHQSVNLALSVAKVSTIYVMVRLFSPSTVWSVKLKMPQEVVGFLEVRADCEDLVDQVLHTDDTEFSCNTANFILSCVSFPLPVIRTELI